jgi:hypothetical protein
MISTKGTRTNSVLALGIEVTRLHGSYLWVTSVDVSSVGGQRLLSNQPFFG